MSDDDDDILWQEPLLKVSEFICEWAYLGNKTKVRAGSLVVSNLRIETKGSLSKWFKQIT